MLFKNKNFKQQGASSEESDSVGRGNSPSNTTGSTTQDADANTINQAETDETMTKDIEARKNDQDMSRRTSRNNTASGTTTTPKSNY